MKNIEKEIEELKEKIDWKLNACLLTNELESNYIRNYIELMKLQAIILLIKDIGSKEKI